MNQLKTIEISYISNDFLGIEKNSGLNAASDVKSNKTKNYLQNKIKILIKS